DHGAWTGSGRGGARHGVPASATRPTRGCVRGRSGVGRRRSEARGRRRVCRPSEFGRRRSALGRVFAGAAGAGGGVWRSAPGGDFRTARDRGCRTRAAFEWTDDLFARGAGLLRFPANGASSDGRGELARGVGKNPRLRLQPCAFSFLVSARG